jgi:hypothetical protein
MLRQEREKAPSKQRIEGNRKLAHALAIGVIDGVGERIHVDGLRQFLRGNFERSGSAFSRSRRLGALHSLGQQGLCFFQLSPTRFAEALSGAIDEIREHSHARSGAFRRNFFRSQRSGDG